MSTRLRLQALSILLSVILSGSPTESATYYVTKSGSDDSTGTSWAAAWETTEKVNTTVVAGDTVYFGTGIWYNSQIRPPGGGNENTQTLYACSTFSDESRWNAKIYGGELVQPWVQYAGNVWAAGFVGSACYEDGCGSLGQDETPVQMTMLLPGDLSQGEYWYNKTTDSIYVWCFDDADPNECEMIASCKPALFFTNYNPDIAYVKFWGLDFRWGQQGTVFWRARTNNISIEHCHISRAGHTSANGSCIFIGASDGGKVATDSSTFGRYNTVKSCMIGNALTIDTSWTRGLSDGIILYSEKYFAVDSCYFYPPLNNAINIKGKGAGTTLEGNKARFNIIVEPLENGIEIWVHPYKDSAYGNVIINPGRHGIHLPVSSLPYKADNAIFNNTIYNSGYGGGDCGINIWVSNSQDGGCGDGHEIKYNVIHSAYHGTNFADFPNTSCEEACVIDSNVYYNIGYGNGSSCGTSWTAWRSCGFDLGGSYGVNPGFADPQNGDFSRPGATQEMNRNDYGDRLWTVWGAVQEADTGNHAPVLASIGAKSVTIGDNLNFNVSATDVDGDSLIFSAEDVPTNAGFQDNYNGTGTFDFDPDSTQVDIFNVLFIVSDGALSDSERVAITVDTCEVSDTGVVRYVPIRK